MDVWENSTAGNGGILKKLVQFFVVSYGQLNVSWDNSWFFAILGSITSELENFSSEVLKDCSEVNWGSSSNSWCRSWLLKESCDSSNWELESSSWCFGDWSSGRCFTFSSSFCGHFIFVYLVFNYIWLKFLSSF